MRDGGGGADAVLNGLGVCLLVVFAVSSCLPVFLSCSCCCCCCCCCCSSSFSSLLEVLLVWLFLLSPLRLLSIYSHHHLLRSKHNTVTTRTRNPAPTSPHKNDIGLALPGLATPIESGSLSFDGFQWFPWPGCVHAAPLLHCSVLPMSLSASLRFRFRFRFRVVESWLIGWSVVRMAEWTRAEGGGAGRRGAE